MKAVDKGRDHPEPISALLRGIKGEKKKMSEVFNVGESVYSSKFGKGFVLGVDDAKTAGRYHVLVRFEGLGDVPYFSDGSRYGREHPDAGDIAIEAEWRDVE